MISFVINVILSSDVVENNSIGVFVFSFKIIAGSFA